MASFSDKGLAVARVYGAAMIELAQGLGEVDVLFHELGDLAGQVDRDEPLRTFLSSPVVDTGTRASAIEKLFRGKYSDLFVDSLQVLNRKGRLELLGAVSETYAQARDELQDKVRVHVKSATPLSDEQREKIKAVVNMQTGKTAELREAVDESLLGGLVVRIGDRKLDTSVARKLEVVKSLLLERAAHEIHTNRNYVETA